MISRYSGKAALASLTIVVVLPVGVALTGRPAWEVLATISVGALVMVRHVANLRRLWHRQELQMQPLPGSA